MGYEEVESRVVYAGGATSHWAADLGMAGLIETWWEGDGDQ